MTTESFKRLMTLNKMHHLNKSLARTQWTPLLKAEDQTFQYICIYVCV